MGERKKEQWRKYGARKGRCQGEQNGLRRNLATHVDVKETCTC